MGHGNDDEICTLSLVYSEGGRVVRLGRVLLCVQQRRGIAIVVAVLEFLFFSAVIIRKESSKKKKKGGASRHGSRVVSIQLFCGNKRPAFFWSRSLYRYSAPQSPIVEMSSRPRLSLRTSAIMALSSSFNRHPATARLSSVLSLTPSRAPIMTAPTNSS